MNKYFLEDIICNIRSETEKTEIVNEKELYNELKELIDYLDSIKDRKCKVLFLGSFGSGKSTIINKFLKRDILPTSITKCTKAIIKLMPSKILTKTKIQIDNKKEKRIRVNKINYYIKSGVIEEDSRSYNEIYRININIPFTNDFKNVEFIDTPGLDNQEELDTIVESEIKNANLAIMVLSANKLFTKNERELAKKINNQLNGNIIFIVNKIDLIDEEEHKELIETVESTLKGTGNAFIREGQYFILSASEKEEKGFLEFLEYLKEILCEENRDQLLYYSYLNSFLEHLSRVIVKLDDLINYYKESKLETIEKDEIRKKFVENLDLSLIKIMELEEKIPLWTNGLMDSLMTMVRGYFKITPRWRKCKKNLANELSRIVNISVNNYIKLFNNDMKKVFDSYLLNYDDVLLKEGQVSIKYTELNIDTNYTAGKNPKRNAKKQINIGAIIGKKASKAGNANNALKIIMQELESLLISKIRDCTCQYINDTKEKINLVKNKNCADFASKIEFEILNCNKKISEAQKLHQYIDSLRIKVKGF